MVDVVELWLLGGMCQLEGLKFCCKGRLKRGRWNDDKASLEQVSAQLNMLSCPCDNLKTICKTVI